VLADPLLDLREQVLGDVNGTGFALYFKGQVMGQMALTGLAVAAGAAAFAAEGHQAGGDERAVELELLDPSLQVAADEGGMLGDFHMAGDDSRFRVVAYLRRIHTSQKQQEKSGLRRIILTGGKPKGGRGGKKPAPAGLGPALAGAKN